MGLSEFQKAWNNYMRAHALAQSTSDQVLEMQVHASMSSIYSALNDHDSATACCHAAQQLAEDLIKQRVPPEVGGVVTRFRRRLATIIARPYRKMGRYNEAMDYCEVSEDGYAGGMAFLFVCLFVVVGGGGGGGGAAAAAAAALSLPE